MPSYTSTALTTVLVVVGGAEVTRLARQKQNADHPAWKQWEIPSAMSPVLGGFALGLFLFAFGIASERLATLFCLLVVIGSLMINGTALFNMFNILAPAKK